MFEKFTDKARKVMSLAQDEAKSLGQMYVGTEHLLLALIKEGDGIAAQALAQLDVSYEETLETVKEITKDDSEPIPGGHIPFTPRAKRVLEDAYRETMSHGQFVACMKGELIPEQAESLFDSARPDESAF